MKRRDLKCEAHGHSAETKISLTFGTCGEPDCTALSLAKIFPRSVGPLLKAKPKAKRGESK